MSIEEAKRVLMVWRESGRFPEDPEMLQALELARVDEGLGRWFEHYRSRQEIIRRELRRIPVPPGLKQQILDGARWPARMERKAVPMRPLAFALGLAAVLALVFTLLRTPATPGFNEYRSRMVRSAQRMYQMDMATNDLAGIRQYLAARRSPADYVLPEPLGNLPGAGCAVLKWQDRPVSLVCLTAANNDLVYFFVINRADLADAPPGNQPVYARIGKLMSASWSDAGKAYVLAAPGDESSLSQYLGSL